LSTASGKQIHPERLGFYIVRRRKPVGCDARTQRHKRKTRKLNIKEDVSTSIQTSRTQDLSTATMPRKTPLSKTFTVNVTPGLHLWPAAMIAEALLPIRSDVTAETIEECADGKSAVELCLLRAAVGTKVKFTATGADAAHALNSIEHLFETQFEAPARSRSQLRMVAEESGALVRDY
jgi:phosphotransferase system HPr (HPr) family protein